MQKSFSKICKTQIIILLYYSTTQKMKKENTFVELVTVIKPFFMEVTSKQSLRCYFHTHKNLTKKKTENEKIIQKFKVYQETTLHTD